MPLTAQEIRQIQLLLALSPQQLEIGSNLRRCIKIVEDRDTRLGLTVINEIKNYLTAIAELDSKINDIKVSGDDVLRSKDIDDEFKVEYRTNIDAAAGLKEQRSKLIDLISRDLDIYRKQNSGRKLRS